MNKREFITLLGGAAHWIAGVVRAQLFYRRQRHGKTSRSEAISWVPCPPQRPRSAMARRWIGGGMLNIE